MTPGRVHPSVALVGSFALAAMIGTLLLKLPIAAVGEPVSLLEAAFTATSAVCVTGLVVVDTGTRFTGFGQGVILLLIQLGGLGIMTYAIFFALLLGRRISFTDRLVLQDALHHSPTAELRKLLAYILPFAFGLEALGAFALWLRWRTEFAGGEAVYQSVFHAVSAFCNAGFSLFPDSMTRYRGDLVVNGVISVLVIVGGLGFLANAELRDQVVLRLRGLRPPPLSLHTRLVLSLTGWLLLAGFLAVLALEWSNLLRGLPLGERLLAAWFQAMTPRTAGFNTLDYGRATAATLFFTISLMFIGASPGSTAGGIKTTTFGLLLLLARARWRGYSRAMVFHRTIPDAVMNRALAVVLLGWVVASGALFALTTLEQGTRAHDSADPRFLALMFEAVSAFGTVGLSTGITAGLSPGGQVVIILLMFVGRVGPLTMALAAGRRRGRGRFTYAEENVMVG